MRELFSILQPWLKLASLLQLEPNRTDAWTAAYPSLTISSGWLLDDLCFALSFPTSFYQCQFNIPGNIQSSLAYSRSLAPIFFPTHVRPGWFSRMPASFISVRADEQNQACWLPFLACSSRDALCISHKMLCGAGDRHPSHSHWGGQALLSCCLYPSWPEQPAANTGTGECLKAKRTNTLSLGNIPSLAYALGLLQSKEKKRGGWHLHSKDWWGKLGLQKWSSLDCAWTFSGCLSPTVKMYMSIPAWYLYRKHFDRIYGFLKNYSHVI